MPGLIISSIIAGILGPVLVALTIPMNKKVVKDRFGHIDFTKSDIYFQWNRWDYVILGTVIYAIICLILLMGFIISGRTINNPYVQFFLHQTFVFTLISMIWLVVRLALVFKGIKQRWPDEF